MADEDQIRSIQDGGRTAAALLSQSVRDRPAERHKRMYDRCSAMARIGVWECDIATEALSWTDGVYDLFDLPRGAPVTRAMTKALYDGESCREMERLRNRAIAERGGFSLDIRITTAKGAPRWIRLTALVECEGGVPARIFGLKQDVTAEKDMVDRLQRLADRDPLTGLANRGLFETRLARAETRPPGEPPLAAVVLIDVDRFKLVNDTFGHGVGDECLKHVAETLRQVVLTDDLAVRLGGDEFAVLLYGPPTVERRIERLIAQNRRRLVGDGRALDVSVSAGIAMAGSRSGSGWAAALVRQADVALYAAKAAGRDTFRLHRPAVERMPWPPA